MIDTLRLTAKQVNDLLETGEASSDEIFAAYRAAIAEERNYCQEAAEDQTIACDDAEHLHYRLARLSLPQREILTLYFLESWSVEQIAEALGVPRGTVKSRMFHARNALRKELSKD